MRVRFAVATPGTTWVGKQSADSSHRIRCFPGLSKMTWATADSADSHRTEPTLEVDNTPFSLTRRALAVCPQDYHELALTCVLF